MGQQLIWGLHPLFEVDQLAIGNRGSLGFMSSFISILHVIMAEIEEHK